jgi:hypothetical protein
MPNAINDSGHPCGQLAYVPHWVTDSVDVDNSRFALIAANLYSSAFCDILSHDVKVAFCQIPRAVLGIDIVTWYQLDKGEN